MSWLNEGRSSASNSMSSLFGSGDKELQMTSSSVDQLFVPMPRSQPRANSTSIQLLTNHLKVTIQDSSIKFYQYKVHLYNFDDNGKTMPIKYWYEDDDEDSVVRSKATIGLGRKILNRLDDRKYLDKLAIRGLA